MEEEGGAAGALVDWEGGSESTSDSLLDGLGRGTVKGYDVSEKIQYK